MRNTVSENPQMLHSVLYLSPLVARPPQSPEWDKSQDEDIFYAATSPHNLLGFTIPMLSLSTLP